MKKRIFLSLALLVTIFVCSQSLFAQTEQLSGRVTNTSGFGLSGVKITVYQIGNGGGDCPDSTTTFALTSPFGYYYTEINHHCTILVFPSKKGYTFTPEYRLFNPVDVYENVDFVGAN